MTDRELLELAAKAAGITLRFLSGACPFSDGPERIGEWNPLTDDGDALRLAVKLRLRHGSDGQSLCPCIECWRAHYDAPRVAEPERDDPYAATRRAIVRAAAAIAQAMLAAQGERG